MTPDALADMHALAFESTRAWSADEFATLLAQPGVLQCGDARCFILIRVTLDEAEVLTLATAPAHRRQGHARAVLATGEAAARQTGAAQIFLEVAADNIAAIGLYDGAGYAQVGARPGYYQPKGGAPIAAMVLRKQLIVDYQA